MFTIHQLKFQCALKKKSRCFILLAFFVFNTQFIHAQDTFLEIGLGIGNVIGDKHNLGKGELHLSIIKPYNFGQIGLDFSTGGNFIPGTNKTQDENIEILSSNDSKFGSFTFLYRLPIKKHFFVEPRFGYSLLSSFVHTDDKTKITQSNFTAGIGIGGNINKFTLSLRYQHLGVTPYYNGVRNTEIVKSNSEPLALILFRVSYRFELNNLF